MYITYIYIYVFISILHIFTDRRQTQATKQMEVGIFKSTGWQDFDPAILKFCNCQYNVKRGNATSIEIMQLMWRKGTLYFPKISNKSQFLKGLRLKHVETRGFFADNSKGTPPSESLSSRRCAPRRIWGYRQLAACNRLLQAFHNFHSHKMSQNRQLFIPRHGDTTNYKEMKICSVYVLHQIGNFNMHQWSRIVRELSDNHRHLTSYDDI